jgi:fluoroacetyl-CoA thioesterase
MPQLEPATLTYVVTDDDTAAAVGSGSLPVLGTPRLLAWLEAATCACLEPVLPDGSTSVGTRVQVEHLAASPVGAEVEVSASSA